MKYYKLISGALVVSLIGAASAHAEGLSSDQAAACIIVASDVDRLERKTEHYEFVLEKIDHNYKTLETRLANIDRDLKRAENNYERCQSQKGEQNCTFEAASFNGFAGDWNEAIQGLDQKSKLFNEKRAVLEGYVSRYNQRVNDYNQDCTQGTITREVFDQTCGSSEGKNSFCDAFNWPSAS